MNNHAEDNGLVVEALASPVDLISLHDLAPAKYPYLLESVAQGPTSQFDILFAFPQEQIILPYGDLAKRNFLNEFQHHWEAEKKTYPGNVASMPFRGGWFVFLGYELAQQIETKLQLPLPAADVTYPVAFATRIPAAIIFSHEQNQIFLIAEKSYAGLLKEIKADIGNINNNSQISSFSGKLHEENPQAFLANVEKIKNYIIAGDVFQVNLSREWQGEWPGSPQTVTAMYRRLRQLNPAPFAGLVRQDDFYILSSSPERLVKVSQGVIETRPIAGTRPRAAQMEDDRFNAQALLLNPKERAEHVMLIDLERNDMGRVCIPGTVKVNELMNVESYAHVHHIVSNLQGKIYPQLAPTDVIKAIFPGGTITGCPKVRCMEIIAELEKKPRGAYTGAMGYINHDGDMDLNILIRTLTVQGRTLNLRAGAGIVADSHPEQELQETRVKARALLQLFE